MCAGLLLCCQTPQAKENTQHFPVVLWKTDQRAVNRRGRAVGCSLGRCLVLPAPRHAGILKGELRLTPLRVLAPSLRRSGGCPRSFAARPRPGCLPPSHPPRPAPYLVAPLEAPGRALVLLRLRGSSGRGLAAVGSRVAGAGALRPARGLAPRRRAPEAASAVEAEAAGRAAAAVGPGPGAVGRRVLGAAVAPRGGRHGAAAAGRGAPQPAAARVRRRGGAEALPVHGRGPPGPRRCCRSWRRCRCFLGPRRHRPGLPGVRARGAPRSQRSRPVGSGRAGFRAGEGEARSTGGDDALAAAGEEVAKGFFGGGF